MSFLSSIKYLYIGSTETLISPAMYFYSNKSNYNTEL